MLMRSPAMNRSKLILATSAAVLGAATLAVAAHGQNPPGQTITLQGGPAIKRDMSEVDVKPRGISVGDRFLVAETLRRDGKPVGRLLFDCTALDASYRGQHCTITLVTRDGQITAQGGGEDRPLPGQGGDPGTSDIYAVTGGTGTYAGARGTLSVKLGRPRRHPHDHARGLTTPRERSCRPSRARSMRGVRLGRARELEAGDARDEPAVGGRRQRVRLEPAHAAGAPLDVRADRGRDRQPAREQVTHRELRRRAGREAVDDQPAAGREQLECGAPERPADSVERDRDLVRRRARCRSSPARV